MGLTKQQQMHRRAQRAEGAVLAALFELELAERFYLRGELARTPAAWLLKRTIADTQKALNRAALQQEQQP